MPQSVGRVRCASGDGTPGRCGAVSPATDEGRCYAQLPHDVGHARDIMAYLITCELERFNRKNRRLLDEVLGVSRRHNVCTCRVLPDRASHSIQVLRRINRRDREERSADSVVSATRIQGDATFRFLDNARPDKGDARDSVVSVVSSPAWAPSLLAPCIASELSRYVGCRLL